MKRRVAASAVLVVLPALVGCDRAAEQERRSAAEVVRAEELVRAADNAHKAAQLSALSAPCAGSRPCEVQRLCREAYQLHVEAVTLTGAAKQQLGDGHDEQAAKLLVAAADKLKRAQADVATCTQRAGDLRRHYKL